MHFSPWVCAEVLGVRANITIFVSTTQKWNNWKGRFANIHKEKVVLR